MDNEQDIEEENQLLNDEEECQPSRNDLLTALLTNMNANMWAMSESLKRLHESNDSDEPNAQKADPAKKAKLHANNSFSWPESGN